MGIANNFLPNLSLSSEGSCVQTFVAANMSFLSKTKMSKCYYCSENMRDENLKAHCLSKHNAAKRVAGEVSVTGFFGPASKKLKFPDASSSTTEEMLLMSGGRQTPEDNLFSRPETPIDALEELGVEIK